MLVDGNVVTRCSWNNWFYLFEPSEVSGSLRAVELRIVISFSPKVHHQQSVLFEGRVNKYL